MLDHPKLDCHIISLKKKNFLLDHNSGLIFNISKEMSEVLKYLKKEHAYSKNNLRMHFDNSKYYNALHDLDQLIKKDYLIQKEENLSNFKTIRLHITEDCNLKCKYCFEIKKKKRMNIKTAYKVVDFILNNSEEKYLKIVFFGGEPLLEIEKIKKIVEYGKLKVRKISNKKLRFAITTNGTLLTDKIINFIQENDIGILLSIDGPKHDNFRINSSNEGTYQNVLANLKKLQGKIRSEIFTVAVTVHHNNLDLVTILKSLIKLGIKQIVITLELTNNPDFALNESDYYILKNQTKKIYNLLKLHPEIKINYYSLTLNENGSFKKNYHCAACLEELTIDTKGRIYPCSLFINNKKFYLGNVIENKFNKSKCNELKKHLSRSINNCKGCAIKSICEGHCLYESYNLYKNVDNRNTSKCFLLKHIAVEKIKYYLSLAGIN